MEDAMRRYCYETTSDLPPELLYAAITDVARWPEWDDEIEAVRLDGPAEPGRIFALKPRGRDAVKLRVEAMVEPFRFRDVAYLPLARLRTEHAFIPTPSGTLDQEHGRDPRAARALLGPPPGAELCRGCGKTDAPVPRLRRAMGTGHRQREHGPTGNGRAGDAAPAELCLLLSEAIPPPSPACAPRPSVPAGR
jgi:hypothetical protein